MNDSPKNTPSTEENPTDAPAPEGRASLLLDRLSRLGLGEQAVRALTTVLVIAVLAVVLWGMRGFSTRLSEQAALDLQATAQAIAAPTVSAATGLTSEEAALAAVMPAFGGQVVSDSGVRRAANPETVIPSRPRVEVTIYVVQAGDSLFSIAEQYGLQPETLLWGNQETLQDNYNFLRVGQELNILPTDGVYYEYNAGESLRTIARFFGVAPEAIVEYPGNRLDPYETNLDSPGLQDGAWLIVPGGERELVDWGPPRISRDNPAVAAYYGPGACGAVYDGPIGNGTFVWPTTSRQISGYSYSDIHPGIDIGGSEGNAIYATDAGVVVYAGWSNTGYGNLVVIDHGNGWQSAYAHLFSYSVSCGQGVFQGGQIGGLGNSGNSTGAHLHFELLSELYGKVNPINFLIP
ncbi:MAG: peptidoglycan DD-metalloendopeptidase family protein [Chloroflexi bacterium]|nr:peptidoglycan DD-metalloendopeptidase family protein [Chloroflexota bacterium]